jgi:periplasmic divalent cation tolerance protein
VTELCQVSIACGSADEAAAVGAALLDTRLAACVQTVGPVESRYWWRGTQETATEWVCVAKSRTALVDEITAAVRAVHSYEVPEVVATPIVGGSANYLAWVEAETSTSADEPS